MKKAQNQFFNRELSWIEFNARVLQEACDKEVPLLERLKFLSIVSSNFDEFFMVRVADLKRQHQTNPNWKDISGLTVTQQLNRISTRVHSLYKTQYECLNNDVLPSLIQKGIIYTPSQKLTLNDKIFTEKYFQDNVFPLLTPLRANDENRIPHFSNLKVHIAFLLSPLIDNSHIVTEFRPPKNEQPLAIVQIPSAVDRIVWLPSENNQKRFTLLDDILTVFGTKLFPGYSVTETLLFRVTCDAAFSVDEDRDSDFIAAMEEVLEARQSAIPVRLTCNNTSKKIQKMLINKLNLQQQDIYEVDGVLDLSSFSKLGNLEDFPELLYPQWKNYIPKEFQKNDTVWNLIKKQDILLQLPYHSFDPVISFINTAAQDESVLAIKITLYRTTGNSPIVRALEIAARNGKQVTAFIELKARFNEKQNIAWATQLQKAGVIVIYGIANLKVHAKMLIVVRKELEGVNRYVYMSTGNYNEITAKQYSDLSIFTSNSEIANDATLFFNMISGYSAIQTMNLIKMAPINLKSSIISMIEREIQHSSAQTPGLIMVKMNSLGHPDLIHALYKASCANVTVLLNIRGICMLVPGIPNLSENIKVVSIIDRYLEHSRIIYFQNGGNEEIYLSSADWMPRNLDRRVELLFPITQDNLFFKVKKILQTYFSDNQKSSILQSDGSWQKTKITNTEKPIRSQETFHEYVKQNQITQTEKLEFNVRRSDI